MNVRTFFFSLKEGVFAAYVVQIKLWISLNVCSEKAQQVSMDQLTHLLRYTLKRVCTHTMAVFVNQKNCGSINHSSQANLSHATQRSLNEILISVQYDGNVRIFSIIERLKCSERFRPFLINLEHFTSL